jgi:hypothetical protein
MSCFWYNRLFSYMPFLHLLIIIYHSKTLFSLSVPRNALQIYVPHSLLRYIDHFYSSKLFLRPLGFQTSSRNKADPIFSVKLHRSAYTLSFYSILRQDLKTVTLYMQA